MKRPKREPAKRHRVTPVWRTELDREGLARALLLLAMHLDEEDRKPHNQGRTTTTATDTNTDTEGSGDNEHE